MYSRVRLAGLALAIRTLALGGPKAAPVGIAPAPHRFTRTCKQGQLFGAIALQLHARYRRRSFGANALSRSAVLDSEGSNECEGLRQHRQPPVAATGTNSLAPRCAHGAAAASVPSPQGWQI